jgi:hypothetical protein
MFLFLGAWAWFPIKELSSGFFVSEGGAVVVVGVVVDGRGGAVSPGMLVFGGVVVLGTVIGGSVVSGGVVPTGEWLGAEGSEGEELPVGVGSIITQPT